nr:hypothetical protein [uncultured Flavobacterium sp.]
MGTTITITGAEALQDVKLHFPHDWEGILKKADADLDRFCHLFKTKDPVEAYGKFLSRAGRPNNATEILAALHLRHLERKTRALLLAQHTEAETKALRVQEQLTALELTTWPEKTKQVLRDFYHGRLAVYQDKVTEIINQMPVFQVENVV